jgi:hypothetical protein
MNDTKVFRLAIETDNVAFNTPGLEIARILRACADKIDQEGVGFQSQTIRDINGNDVGRYALKPQSSWS